MVARTSCVTSLLSYKRAGFSGLLRCRSQRRCPWHLRSHPSLRGAQQRGSPEVWDPGHSDLLRYFTPFAQTGGILWIASLPLAKTMALAPFTALHPSLRGAQQRGSPGVWDPGHSDLRRYFTPFAQTGRVLWIASLPLAKTMSLAPSPPFTRHCEARSNVAVQRCGTPVTLTSGVTSPPLHKRAASSGLLRCRSQRRCPWPLPRKLCNTWGAGGGGGVFGAGVGLMLFRARIALALHSGYWLYQGLLATCSRGCVAGRARVVPGP